MKDHKALQSGTSHYFGDGFCRAFNIVFADKNNQQSYPHETSWGMSTRTIGGLIMTHGDNNGLVLPPHVAPIQVVVVPVAQHKPGVLEKAAEVYDALKAAGIRVKMDDSDNSLGWKCAQYEMKGVPLRIELGPRDIENGVCVAVRRDSFEKTTVQLSELAEAVPALLEAVQKGLYDRAKKNLDEHTRDCETMEEVKTFVETEGGFARTKWCGDLACELQMKESAGVTSRCIPFTQRGTKGKCVCCGKEAETDIYWGVAY